MPIPMWLQIVIGAVLCLAALWLLRGVLCWYAKINVRLDLQQGILDQLKEMNAAINRLETQAEHMARKASLSSANFSVASTDNAEKFATSVKTGNIDAVTDKHDKYDRPIKIDEIEL